MSRKDFYSFVSSTIRLSIFLTIFALSCFYANAQDLDDVTISGRIIDQNGAGVAGATVRAKFIATVKERTVVADAEGHYRFVELQPGVYELVASFKHFQDTTVKELQIVAGQNIQLNITLYPQGISVQTVVDAGDETPLVDTTRTVVGGTITKEKWKIFLTTRARRLIWFYCWVALRKSLCRTVI